MPRFSQIFKRRKRRDDPYDCQDESQGKTLIQLSHSPGGKNKQTNE